MGLSLALLLGLVAGVHFFNGGYYIKAGAGGKNENNIALGNFVKENNKEIAALAAVTDYAVNGNNPKAVTAKYQELARKFVWFKTIEWSETEGHYANLGKELNKLPSRLAAVKANTKDAVIAKQKTLFSNLVAVFAAELEHQDSNGGSQDQNKVELASFFAKIFEAYIKFHSENERNDNDRVEAN